ncbi:hypothetical protein F0726_02969 [Acidithiobacillus caldus]|nr:hypothetical protein F0726_02969 [Acidithiobacillus caldus]
MMETPSSPNLYDKYLYYDIDNVKEQGPRQWR